MRVVQVITKKKEGFSDQGLNVLNVIVSGMYKGINDNVPTLVGTSEDFFNGGEWPCPLMVFIQNIASMSTQANKDLPYMYVLSGLVNFSFKELAAWNSLSLPYISETERKLLLGFLLFLQQAIDAEKADANSEFLYKEQTAPDNKHSIILDDISNMCGALICKKIITAASQNYTFSATITFLIKQSSLSEIRNLTLGEIVKMFSIKGKFALGIGQQNPIIQLIDRKSTQSKEYSKISSYHLNILYGEIFEDFLKDQDGTTYSVVFRNCADASFGFPQNIMPNQDKRYCFIVSSNLLNTSLLFDKLFNVNIKNVNDNIGQLKDGLTTIKAYLKCAELPKRLNAKKDYYDFLLFSLRAAENQEDIKEEMKILNTLLKELDGKNIQQKKNILNNMKYSDVLSTISSRLFAKQRAEKSLQSAPCVYQFPYSRTNDLTMFSTLTKTQDQKKYTIVHTTGKYLHISEEVDVLVATVNMPSPTS